VKTQDKAALAARKARLDSRLDPEWQPYTSAPVLAGANTSYEVSARVNAIPCGGIALLDQMVRSLGLPAAIDKVLSLFKVHKPYFESDHVLNIAYNVLCGGTCLEDIELLRNNPSYLDALGAHRVPDQTTAGDFLRRFEKDEHVHLLMEAINEVRLRVWKRLPRREKKLALIDVDGTIAPTLGDCKEGMDISYKGTWGYHPLLVTLANTQEVLYTKNRPGNRPSHDGAAPFMDAAVTLVRQGGFERVRLRGDTDFSFTGHFDGWTKEKVEFVFGIDANQSFVARASEVHENDWKALIRPPSRAPIKTEPRERPTNVKEIIVKERGFTSIATEIEDVIEFPYRPTRSDRDYRMVVLRKTLRVTEGQKRLADEIRYFFFVTNVPRSKLETREVVFESNARCNQENVIEQLKNGVRAMRMPSDSLLSNWAYLVIASLAWNMKAWLAITIPQPESAKELRRMEFRRFLNSVMLIPAQVVHRARRLVLRLLTWTPWAKVLLDGLTFYKRARLT
jgi:hypothetical protein